MQELLSKKFLLTVLLIVCFTVLTMVGIIPVGYYLTAVTTLASVYMGANVTEKFATLKKPE